MSSLVWQRRPLGELVELNPGSDTSISAEADVTFVPMAAVTEETGLVDLTRRRRYGDFRRGFRPFRDGDVLFAKITPSMENGKAAVVRGLAQGHGLGSTEFHVLRPSNTLDANFLRYFLSQKSIRAEARRHMTGTAGQLRVPARYLSRLEVPVPPLHIQRQIVDAIEQQLTRLDSGRALLQVVKSGLRRNRDAIFRAAVGGHLVPNEAPSVGGEASYESTLDFVTRVRPASTRESRLAVRRDARQPDNNGALPDGWIWAALLDLGQLDRGKSRHRPRNDARILGGAYPFIQTGDVRRSGGIIREHSATYNEAGLAQSRLWPAGTLCITIAANIAETGILSYPACFPDSVVGFVHVGHPDTTRYVELCLRAMKRQLWSLAPATAQKNINLETLRDIRIPLPPLAEQIRIVQEVDRLISLAEAVEHATAESLSRSDHLRSAILTTGLSGRLLDSGVAA